MALRLQKFLAQAGVASRRKSEELILNGRVKVNNITVRELGTKVDPQIDTITYEGKVITKEEKQVYYMLHKPVGYVTTVQDEKGRKTVLDLLSLVPERIYPVGRLDFDTSGLLLLTNDGDLTYLITHPKHEIPKTYIAKVQGIPTEAALEQFRNGLLIEKRMTSKAEIKMMSKGNNFATLSITIIEGRNRQVRKMCAAIGTPVISLKRESVGSISIGDLKLGQYRPLSEKEINYLKNL